MAKITYIPGEIANAAIDEHGNRKPVTRTQHIFDDNLEKPQSEVNKDRIEDVATLDGKIALEKQRAEGVESGLNNRLGTVEQLAEISIGGGDAQIATGEDFTNPDATKRAKVTTVGAIIDGLNDGVYDVSKRNPSGGPNSDGKFTLEYILSNANTLIPTSWRHGGMSISFVSTYDNKYVQARCMAQNFTTDVTQWQGVDVTPTNESRNLAESGGVYKLTYEELFDLSASFNPISEDTVATRTDKVMNSSVFLSANKTYYIKAKGTLSAFTTKEIVLYYRHEGTGSAVYVPLYTSDGQSLSDGIYLKYTPEYDGRLSVRSYTEGDSIYVAAVNVEDGINEMLLAENYSEVGAITYNDNNAIQSYNVEWADGTSGIYTSTDWDEANNMYKGYTVTYGDSLILTQPAVTVVNGLIISVPQKTITSQS